MLLVYLNDKEGIKLTKFNGIDDFLKKSRDTEYESLRECEKILCLTKDIVLSDQVSYTQLVQLLSELQQKGIFVHEYATKKFKSIDWWSDLVKKELDKEGILPVLTEDSIPSTIMQVLYNVEDLSDLLNDKIDPDFAKTIIDHAITDTFCDEATEEVVV